MLSHLPFFPPQALDARRQRRHAVPVLRRGHGRSSPCSSRCWSWSSRSASGAARPTTSARRSTARSSLELTWTFIPLVIAMVMFVWGASVYFAITTPPSNAMEIYVVGKRWMWKAQHVTGQREINELHVPVGQPVKLIIGSEDVIHAYYIPAFRMKMDAVPGRTTTMWFEADARPATYQLFCAEYCGMSHSRMIGKVTAMEPARVPDVARRRQRRPARWPTIGAKVFTDLGCVDLPPGRRRGPRPVAARRVRQSQVTLANGEKVTADEAYIRESILTPTGQDGAGYQPLMPTFQGVVSEEQIAQLTAYIKSLARSRPARGGARDAPAPAPRAGTRTRRTHEVRANELDSEASIAKPTNYLNATHGAASWFLTKDHKRIALLYLYRRLGLLPHRRHLRDAHPPGAADAGRRPRQQRDLQQVLHDARRDDGVLLPDPVDPGDARQLPGADDDRRQGPRLPAHQPAELVHLHGRRPVRRRRAWSRAASTPAGRSTRRTARRPRTPTSC